MNTNSENKLIILFGPTAVGKTDTLIRLNNDDRLHSEKVFQDKPIVVVSADSIQMYKKLSIGSAKPNPNELKQVPHKLIDFLEPDEDFSVFDFVEEADKACTEIIKNGGIPIISGGTAYYIKAFMFGPPSTPISVPSIRKEIENELNEKGLEELRKELFSCDFESYQRIKPQDTYRICRALEVYRSSGKPLSTYKVPTTLRDKWNMLVCGLNRDREELYSRINLRVDLMIKQGLKQEVESLIKEGYTKDTQAMKGIGYTEFFEENLSEQEIIEKIKKDTRHYAKRQVTFMRSLPLVKWLDSCEYDKLVELIIDFWNK